jgi:Chlorophyll A-B binding protein
MRGFAFILVCVLIVIRVIGTDACFRPPPLAEELGCSPTLSWLKDPARYAAEGRGFVYFDPLGLATDANFARYRESELKHGRVAMLAVAQVLLVPLLKDVEVLPADFPENILSSFKHPGDATKVILTCFILEAFVFVQRDFNAMPGDYGTGFFGVRDKAANEEKLVAELEHGRLAMIGIVGYLASDYISHGKPWPEQWMELAERYTQNST